MTFVGFVVKFSQGYLIFYPKELSEAKMKLIQKSFDLAVEAHSGVLRKYTNRPFIEHPVRVAQAISQNMCLQNDNVFRHEVLIAAGYLHDVIEDAPTPDLKYQYVSRIHDIDPGGTLFYVVDKLTNRSKGSKLSRAARKQMDRDFLSVQPRAIRIIKMIDRLDNLREIGDAPADFMRLYAEESELLVQALTIREFPDQELVDEINKKIMELK